MKIKGNLTYKDNNKLVYINLILVAMCAYLLYVYYQERNFKDIVMIDSAHEIYHGRMVRVPDKEAIAGQIKAHIGLSYTYLYNLSEYSYPIFIVKALHLWSYEGKNIVSNYEREGLYDLLSTTPTRTEGFIKNILITGQKTIEELQYPEMVKDIEDESISFVNKLSNNVVTYTATVESYHIITEGSKILSEEIHIEEVEIYTGFSIEENDNPFGMKIETISREVQQIKD